MQIIFSEASRLQDSVFGIAQNAIARFLEARGQGFEQESMLKSVYCMGTSQNPADVFTGMTAMEGFKPVGENGAHPVDGMQEGFQKTLVYETWKDSFSISREAMDDGKIMDLKQKPAAFLLSYYGTRERFGACLYGSAIKTQPAAEFGGKKFDIKTADGKPLFDKAHPAKVKGAVQTNQFVDAFSDDALGKMETAMQNFKGDNDELLDVAPDTILIPNIHSLKKKVFAAVGADKEPTTGNNAFNYQFGRWNIIIWNYLNRYITASTEPWILMDSKFNELYGGAIFNDRVELEVTSSVERNTNANIWDGYARFNGTFNDWRFGAVGGVAGGSTLPG